MNSLIIQCESWGYQRIPLHVNNMDIIEVCHSTFRAFGVINKYFVLNVNMSLHCVAQLLKLNLKLSIVVKM